MTMSIFFLQARVNIFFHENAVFVFLQSLLYMSVKETTRSMAPERKLLITVI